MHAHETAGRGTSLPWHFTVTALGRAGLLVMPEHCGAYQLRKIIKSKGHFPSDEAASKLLFLALRNAEKRWSVSPKTRKSAMNQFHIQFEGRLPV